jgi:hypothetical protein
MRDRKRLPKSLIKEFAEVIVPSGAYESFCADGELRLIDWEHIYEMAIFVSLDASLDIIEFNRKIKMKIASGDPHSSGYMWQALKITTLKARLNSLRIIEEFRPHGGHRARFESDYDRCKSIAGRYATQ